MGLGDIYLINLIISIVTILMLGGIRKELRRIADNFEDLTD